jgi:hypothetical protein
MNVQSKSEGKSNPQEIERATQDWIASPAGKKCIEEILNIAETMSSKISEARKIDPRELHDPITL